MSDNGQLKVQEVEPEPWPADWPKWVLEILEEIEREDERFGKLLLGNDVPLWVARMSIEMVKPFAPGLRVTDLKQPGAHYLGRLLGYYDALLAVDGFFTKHLERCPVTEGQVLVRVYVLGSPFPYFNVISKGKWERCIRKQKRWEAKLRRTKRGLQRLARWEAFVARWRAAHKAVMKGLLRVLARKRMAVKKGFKKVAMVSLKERTEFHTGYAEGLSGGNAAGEEDLSMTPVLIYWMMVYSWPAVQQLPSRFQLWKHLCQCLPHRKISLDAVNQMCTRYKIRFRGRGAPRKAEHEPRK